MINDLTLDRALAFFKAFKGDDIVFDTPYCGTYTDFYSEIDSIGISTLRVKVDKNYINPDCVDKDNLADIPIGSIRKILNTNNTPLELHEIDGKILSLRAFLLKNKIFFNPAEQETLEKLLQKLESFYSQTLLESDRSPAPKINRNRFSELFLDL